MQQGSGSEDTGVPRCEELIRVTKNIKTPIMKIHLNKNTRENKDMVTKFHHQLVIQY